MPTKRKLPKITNYVKNVGKSLAFASVDVIKDNTPGITEFLEANNETFKKIYSGAKNYKQSLKTMERNLKQSSVYKTIDMGIKSAIEDAKNGTFYNTTRAASVSEETLGMDDDFDFNMTFEEDDEGSSSSGKAVSNDSRFLAGSLEGAISSSAIANSTAVAQGTATVVKSNRVNTQLIMANMDKISHTITSGLGTLYNPVNDINKFMQGPLHNHLENSKLYYENSIKTQQEMQAMMKEMLDMQRALYKGNESSDRNNQTPLDAIFSGGTFDLDAYLKNVKSNLKDKLDDSGLGMMFDNGGINPMLMMAAAPFNDTIKSIINKALPETFKKALKSFDKGVSTLMSTFITQMNNNSKNEDGIWEQLGEILGFKTDVKKKLDTSKYKKDATPFDGITKKAITEVIPGYLSRIEAAVTGKNGSDARHYDYENGQWKSAKEIEGDWKKLLQEQVARSNYELIGIMRKNAELMSKEAGSTFMDDFMSFINQVYEEQGDVRLKKRKADDEEPFMHYNINPSSMRVIEKILTENPKLIREMAYNNMKGNQDHTRMLKDIESKGSSSFNVLFDRSYDNGIKNNRGKPSAFETTSNIINMARDREGKGIFYYLKEILTTLKSRPVRSKGNANGTKAKKKNKRGGNKSGGNSSSDTSSDDDGGDPDAEYYEEKTTVGYESVEELMDEIDRQKAEENKKENNKRALGNWLRDKIGDTTVGKFILKVSDKLGGILNKPLQYATDLLNKADKKLFDLMFGDKLTIKLDGEDYTCSNLLEYVGLSVRKVFDDAGKWIKENFKKVFDSLKNRFQPLIDKYISPVWENMKDILGRGKDRVAEAFPNTFGKWFDIADEKRRERRARKQAEKDMENGGVSSADDVENAANGVETSAAGRFVTKRGLTMISPGEIIIPASFDPKEQAKMLALEKRDRRRILNAMGNGKISLNAKGTVSKEELNKTKETLSKIYNDNKGKASRNTAAGLLGAGAGILTGFGPVIGAVAGAGLSILTNSETFKTVMFGKTITDEEGNTVGRSGGVVSKKIYDVFKKAAPDMGDFGVAGGLLGLFTPFGPLGGAAIGAGVGFLKNSESFHKFIFGDEATGKDGIMKKETYDKFKSMVDKAVPNMAVGAVGGALFGPFGLLGNAAMGAGLGLLSSTDTFKKFLFGEDAEWQGNETGGMVGALYRGIVMPAQKHITEIFTDLKEWGKENILKPLKNAWEPVKQMIKNVFTDLGNSLKNMFKDMVGKPIYDFLQQKIFKPVTNAIFKIIKLPLNLAKGAISLPFKAIQGLGNSLRMSQIRRGTANDMSAGQRLAFRDEHKVRAFGNNLFGRDNTIDQDKMIAGMQIDELSNLSNLLGASLTGKDKIKRDADHASISAGNSVSKILNAKQDDGGILWDLEVLKKKNGFKLKKLASEGKVKEYETLVKELDLSDETKKKFLDSKVLSAIKTAGVTSKRAELSDKDSKDLDDAIENITGRKMNSRQKGHLLSNLESEIGIREKLNDKETASEFGNTPDGLVRATKEYQEIYAQRTQDLIDTLDQSNKYLEKLTSAKGLDDLNELDYDNKKSLIEAISKGFERALNKMKSNLSNAGHYGEGIVEDAVNGTFNTVGNAGRKIANSKAANAVKEGASKAAEGIKNVFGDGEPDIETNAFGGMSKRKTASIVSAGESIQPRDSFLSVMKKTLVKPIAGLAASIRNKPVLDPTTGNMITNDPDSKENTENVRKHQEMERRDIEQLETSKSSVGIFKAFGEKLFGGKKKKGGILSSIGSGLGGILKFLGVGTGSIAKMGLKVLGIAGGVSLLGFASQWFKTSAWPVMKNGLFGEDGKSGLIGGVVNRVKNWFEGGGFSNLLSEKIIPNFITGLSYSMENIIGPSIALLIKHLPSILWGLAKGLFKGLKSITFKHKMDGQEEKEMLAASGFQNSSAFLDDFAKMNSQKNRSLESNMDPAMRKSLTSITSSNNIAYASANIGGGLGAGGESRSDSSSGNYTTNTSSAVTNNYITQNASKFADGELENPNQTLTVEKGPMGLLGRRRNTNIVRYDDQGNVLTQYDRRNTQDSLLSSTAKAAGLSFRKGILTGKSPGRLVNKLSGMKIAKPKAGLLGNIIGGTKNTIKAGANVIGSAGNLGSSLYENAFNSVIDDSRDASGLTEWFKNRGGEAAANFAESRNLAKTAAKEATETVAETGAKKGISKVLKAAGDAISDTSLIKGIKELFERFAKSEMVERFCNFAKKRLKKAIDPSLVQNAIRKIGTSIAERCVKSATKTALKEATEQIANACTLGLATIAFFIADFIYGFNNAYTMLGVAKGGEYEVNFGMKCACGIVHALVNLIPFVGGFIPTDILMQFVMKQIAPIFGYDPSSLKKAQEESSKLMDEWNKEHPDEQYDNLEDFNNKDKLWTKIKKSTGKAFRTGWEKTKSTASKGVELVKKGVSAVASKTKEVVDKSLNIGSFIKTVSTNVVKAAIDPEFNWNIDELITEDDPLAGAKRTLYQVLKVPLGIVAMVTAAGKFIFDKVKGFAINVKDGVKDAWEDIKSVAKGEYSVFNKEYWKFNDEDSDNPLNMVGKISSAGLKFMAMPTAMIGYVGSKVWKDIKAIIADAKEGNTDSNTDVKAVINGEYTIFNSRYWKSDEADDGNELSLLGKIFGFVTRVLKAPGAMIGYVGNKVSKWFMKIIGEVSSGASDSIDSITEVKSGEYSIFNSKYWDVGNDTDNPLSKLGTVAGYAFRIAYAPAAMTGYVATKVKEKFNNFVENVKTLDTENAKVIERAEQGQISVFSSDYWKMPDKDYNGLGVLGTVASFIERLVNAPIIAIKGTLNKIKEKIGGSNIGQWFSRIFGENNSDSKNGMGKHYGFGRVSQLDPDVANMPYNGHTIGEAGCGPVAATNLINGMYQGQYGGDIVSLQDAAEYATANGYKPSNDGTDPRFMRSILNKYGIRTSGVTGRNQIEQNLMSGNPVVLMGKGNSPDSPYGNNNPHYITAVGFDDNGNVIVDDPYERELTTYPENEVMNGVIDSISAKGYGKKPMSRIRRTISRGYGKASRHTISRRRGFGKYGFGRFGFGKILGHISAKYETGGWNPGMVSSGAGDHGGISYGLSQFSTTQGSAKSFVSWLSKKYPTLGSYFEGLSPGTSAFGNAWKKCYSEHGDEFANAQTEYTYENMVQPWINKAKSKTGIDFSRSMALKEAAYSTAVQFGPSGLQMLKNVTSGMSDQEVITAMYDDKINNVSTYFRSSSSSVQAGVKSRFQREKQDLLDLIGKDGEYSYTGPGSAPSGSGTSGNSTSGTLLNQFTNLGTSMVKAMFGDDAYEALYGSQNSGDESSGSSSMAGNGSVESFVQTALNEEGYHEKASNSNLDDKTANSGSRNYTKYGQHFNLNGQPWCAQFVSWSADKAGIPATAINRTASVSSFNEFFKSKNRFHGPGSGYTPKRGDVFMRGGEHTGIVTGITDGKLKTIEGNTSDTVAQRSYNLSTCGFSYGDLGLGSGSGTSGMEGTTETTKAFGKGRIRRNAKTQYAKQMKYGYGVGSPTVTYAGTPTTYYNTNSSNQGISYEVFLQTIITILTNIADNSAVLSKILEILSSQFNINIDKTDLDKASAKTKEQTEASLRDLINRSNNNNTGISKLLNNRDTEYVIKAMKAIASE